MQKEASGIQRHLHAQIVVCLLLLSHLAVPFATAAAGSTKKGADSLLQRRLERKQARLAELYSAPMQPVQHSTARGNRPEKIGLAAKVAERRTERLERAGLRPEADAYHALRQAILDAVNHERALQGLPALTMNNDLQTSAQLHAEDMLARAYFAHTTPEGLSHVDRIKHTGYAIVDMEYCNCAGFKAALGENLAKGQRSVNWVMNEWMASPTHRDNILSPHFTELGVGIAEGKGSGTQIADRIWVQNFGSLEMTPNEKLETRN
ncbi:hypothetical protein COU76_03710 [Candidatus Peregrinibacteria bacterium CG10_big_fil_rev_8_21_14_0_10_49_10]|nr:MAG: hypothetical protein COU76_03710 [Candidatus Peregrinibacteria bacterium CG10_big_fil_rev_8_21_14_0_10_49_10]